MFMMWAFDGQGGNGLQLEKNLVNFFKDKKIWNTSWHSPFQDTGHSQRYP